MEYIMSISDWLMITAVILGPIVAVQLTRHLDKKKEIRERKLWVFKTLMATRASSLSPHHVEALNRIDLEFDVKNQNEKAVIEAWKAYLDLLGDTQIPQDQWGTRRVDLLIELLHKMAKVLDYEFDKTHIKNSSYYPRGYGELQEDQAAIRRGVKELIEGRRVIPMHVTNLPPLNRPEEANQANSTDTKKIRD
jgi:hypothetical protein